MHIVRHLTLTPAQRKRLRHFYASDDKDMRLGLTQANFGGPDALLITMRDNKRLDNLQGNKGIKIRISRSLINENFKKGFLSKPVPITSGGAVPIGVVLTAAQTGLDVFNNATAAQQAEVGDLIQRRLASLRRQGAGIPNLHNTNAFLEGAMKAMKEAQQLKKDSPQQGSGFFQDFAKGFAYGFNPANWPTLVELAATEIDAAIANGQKKKGKGMKINTDSMEGSGITFF